MSARIPAGAPRLLGSGEDFATLDTAALLRLYADVLGTLRDRGVIRTKNNPVADYAEGLFSGAFGWMRAPKQSKGHDAVDLWGRKFEIKARRLTVDNPSRQLSAIRSLDTFDSLAAILFHMDFTVYKAAIIPVVVVRERVRRSSHTAAWLFNLTEDVWRLPGVEDATECIKAHVLRPSPP